MRYTINLDCKTHHISQDGKIPLLLRVSLNGQHIYINIRKSIKVEYYDKAKKSIKSGISGFTSYNSFIDRQKVRIDEIIKEHENLGSVLSPQRLRELYYKRAGEIKSDSFYDYVENEIKEERKLKEITESAIRNYEKDLVKLKVYRKTLSIHDITKDFLTKYKAYILNDLKQANNTAYHAMCFLRKYTKRLFKEGKIGKYPFDDFIVGKPFEVNPEYLEPNELNRLHDLYSSKELLSIVKNPKSKYAKYKSFPIGQKYQEVLRYYLAACYCGLRHSDIKTLKMSELKGGYVVKEMQKGRLKRKKIVRIPLNNRLKSLIDMSGMSGLAFENPVMENSQTNKYLKKIAQIAGINKHLTFHSSRHTFAINSLILGVSIEVISDVLGHSELTTTQRYARIVDTQREQEMKKWDKKEVDCDDKVKIICPSCENTVMAFEPNTIRMNKINCTCQYCNENFSYSITERKISSKLSIVA
ncbi:MAG TPA: tyrosine-type recombinase/integrase [Bacteroidia bacterium]|nr:tyrosine-type recombinase/integrase [Bacteroidia bacterium]